jgi:phage/plasmid-like protein (TIGR03299 family)
MAHEITNSDGLVLHKEMAWHGLGTVVEKAPTIEEALQLASMDWNVNQSYDVRGTMQNGDSFSTDKWVLNVRSDNSDVLGCVSSGFRPIQNTELAKFCEELSLDSVVKVESAGSLLGGRKVWFLLKTDSFNVGPNDDPVTPYILVSNGHDGTLAFSGMTTSVRVVCNNTLSWAMKGSGKVFSYKHTANLFDRLPAAKIAMRKALTGKQDFEDACKYLRNRTMKTEEVNAFFVDVYAKVVDPIVKMTAQERYIADETDRRYDNACTNIYDMSNTFDMERDVAGTTYWNAFNATSRWLQNRNRKGGDTQAVNKVMGVAADNTSKAFKLALAAAGA